MRVMIIYGKHESFVMTRELISVMVTLPDMFQMLIVIGTYDLHDKYARKQKWKEYFQEKALEDFTG